LSQKKLSSKDNILKGVCVTHTEWQCS
jgi:hypothetical protein